MCIQRFLVLSMVLGLSACDFSLNAGKNGPGLDSGICDSSTCVDGCCSPEGVCQLGSAGDACGAHAGRCSDCTSLNLVCNSGLCVSPDTDGGPMGGGGNLGGGGGGDLGGGGGGDSSGGSGGSSGGGSDGGSGGGSGCQPDSDAILCANQSALCGVIRATDNCGVTRVALCGQCNALGDIPFVPTGPGVECLIGAYEPGNQASSYAFETAFTDDVAFDPRLTDAGMPVSSVTWSPFFRTPLSLERLFFLRGPTGGDTFDGVGIPNASVEPHSGAAMISGDTLYVNIEGAVSLPPKDGVPAMAWYSRCYGKEKLTPFSGPNLCAYYGFECSSLNATDNTGVLASVASCGSCPGQKVCRPKAYFPPRTENVSWPAKRCRDCVNESDAQFCQRLGASCDVITALDDCDVSRTVNCGPCTSPTTCGGGGSPNVCGGTGGITCTTAVVATPPTGNGPGQCPVDGDGGVTVKGTQTFSDMTFTWNPQRLRYQFATTVYSPATFGVLELYLYSANATTVDWSEGEGMTSSRTGNVITVDGYFQRSYPLGCNNSHIYAECRGTGPFVFAP